MSVVELLTLYCEKEVLLLTLYCEKEVLLLMLYCEKEVLFLQAMVRLCPRVVPIETLQLCYASKTKNHLKGQCVPPIPAAVAVSVAPSRALDSQYSHTQGS